MCTRKEVTKSPRDMDQHEAFSRDTNWHPMFYFLKPIYQTTKQPPSSKLYFFYFPSMITKFVADHILQQHTHNTMGSKTRRCNITQELIYQCIHWWMGFGPTLYIKAFRWGCSPTVKIFFVYFAVHFLCFCRWSISRHQWCLFFKIRTTQNHHNTCSQYISFSSLK
jgi:hypothetical protein